jgi:hypothetical protein
MAAVSSCAYFLHQGNIGGIFAGSCLEEEFLLIKGEVQSLFQIIVYLNGELPNLHKRLCMCIWTSSCLS